MSCFLMLSRISIYRNNPTNHFLSPHTRCSPTHPHMLNLKTPCSCLLIKSPLIEETIIIWQSYLRLPWETDLLNNILFYQLIILVCPQQSRTLLTLRSLISILLFFRARQQKLLLTKSRRKRRRGEFPPGWVSFCSADIYCGAAVAMATGVNYSSSWRYSVSSFVMP